MRYAHQTQGIRQPMKSRIVYDRLGPLLRIGLPKLMAECDLMSQDCCEYNIFFFALSSHE